MRFSTITDDFFDLVSFEEEIMQNKGEKRPYLIILKLKYKGQNQNFAIPFRSNISRYIPKDQYYSLPPRFTTQNEKIHGLHYLKMFPLRKKYLQKYNTDNDPFFKLIQGIVEKNRNEIIAGAQAYLTKYEAGERTSYCVDIDKICSAISIAEITETSNSMKEIVATIE